MSDRFNGFSQEEIKKMTTTKTTKSGGAAATETLKQAFKGHNGIRRMPEKWAKTSDGQKQAVQQQKQPLPTGALLNARSNAGVAQPQTLREDNTLEEINLDRSMSKSIEEALFYLPTLKKTATTTSSMNGAANGGTTSSSEAAAASLSNSSSTSVTDDSSILKLPMDNNVSSSSSSSVLNDSSILVVQKPTATADNLNVDSPFKGISLKDFESHRRMIEEQNKQKKELLYKAIEHHSQKTAAEARKIEDIKSELSKLDNDLAVDVAILRKQIDNACVNFANIEKQYIKIEAQFLKAKIDLHNAAEKKELLTEHLCTVIAHNEDRKAQKLTELMHKVGLTPSGDYDVVSTTTTPPIITTTTVENIEENVDK